MRISRIFLLTCVAILIAQPALAQDERPYAGTTATNNETRLATQENELRALNGRLEQLEFLVRRLDQTLQKLQTDMDSRLTRLETAQPATAAAAPPPPVVAPPVVVPPVAQQPQPAQPAAAQSQSSGDANGTLGALKLQNGKVTGGVNKPQSPALPSVPADYGLTPQEQYERAFNFLREANYSDAEDAFKSFIDKNPKDKLIDNAKYWYGETLYVRGRYDVAAVAFADAYQQNPVGTKAPDSLLKLGISLGALNKTSDACVTFNELKVKYPKVAPAIKARADEERAKLKCPAH
jgi:tol-pal system protein YbgF